MKIRKDKIYSEVSSEMNSKVPCINCITFPICLATYKQNINKGLNHIFERTLCKKCKLLSDYIYVYAPVNNDPNRAFVYYLLKLSTINDYYLNYIEWSKYEETG